MEESCAPYKSLGFYQILRLLVGTILGPLETHRVKNRSPSSTMTLM